MKKLIATLAVVVLVLILAGPFAAGFKTQQAMDNLVAYLNDQPGYSAQWTGYDRGWFGSRGQLAVALQLPTADNSDALPVLPLDFDISHGPVMLRDGLHLGWSAGTIVLGDEVEGWLRDKLSIAGEGPFCQSDFRMSLLGAISFEDHCQVASIQLDSEPAVAAGTDDEPGSDSTAPGDAQTLHLESYRGGGTYDRNGKLTYAGTLPGARLESAAGGTMEIGEFTLRTELDLGGFYSKFFVPGQAHFALASISGKTAEGDEVNLTDLQISSVSSFHEENTLSDVEVEMSLASFVGLGENLADARLVLSFNRVRVEFWEKYSDLMQQMAASDDTASAGFDLLGLVMSDLVPSGPGVQVKDFGFTTDDGSLNLSAEVNISPDAAQSADPMGLIRFLQVDVNADVSKALAQTLMEQSTRNEIQTQLFDSGEPWTDAELEAQVKDQAAVKLNMLVVQGMLKDDGDDYRIDFNYRDGNATLNGEAMPLPF